MEDFEPPQESLVIRLFRYMVVTLLSLILIFTVLQVCSSVFDPNEPKAITFWLSNITESAAIVNIMVRSNSIYRYTINYFADDLDQKYTPWAFNFPLQTIQRLSGLKSGTMYQVRILLTSGIGYYGTECSNFTTL